MTKNNNPELPKSLVRFYGNPEYALDCIENNQITLIHTSKFNDPFDPTLNFITECDWQYKSFISWMKANRKKDLQSGHFQKTNWLPIRKELEKIYANIKKTMFTACFCSPYTIGGKVTDPQHNLYMWGHYGNGHRGIAIQFDPHIFKDLGIYSMEYRDSLPSVTNEDLYHFVFKRN